MTGHTCKLESCYVKFQSGVGFSINSAGYINTGHTHVLNSILSKLG